MPLISGKTRPTCGIGWTEAGTRCPADAVAVIAVTTHGPDVYTPDPTTGVVFLCVEHYGWLPHAERPIRMLTPPAGGSDA